MSKRILSLVLALVMVLGTFSFSLAAPSDVEGTDYEKAVERLMLLGIITGYPDGSFKPENNITRAEFAAVALRARGLEYTAQAAKGLPTGFSDVPASHWASGYVGAAAKAGIVNGIGNGKFAPEAPVKYEEAVTMLVRALGYEVDAQAKGGYPHGYLIVANEIGLLDEVRGIPGAPATRGMVAQMTDNALEIAMMIQVGYGDEAKWVVSGTEGTDRVTLLNKLDVDEITGDVIATFRIDSSLDNDEIKIKELNGKTTTFEITENIDADAVLGAGVTAWAKDDVIFAISIGYEEEIRGKNYSFDADQIAYDEISAADDEEVELYVKDDTFDWEDAVVYLNNEKVKDLDDTDLVGAYGRFIFNEDDEVVFAYLFKFDDVGLVTSISEDEIEFINAADADEDGLALDDAEEIYVFNKDLSAASLDDIEEDTAIFFWIDADDNYYIVINNEKVEGTLEAVRTTDSRVTVDGTNMVPGSKRGAFSVYSADAKNKFNLWEHTNFSAIKDYVDEDVVVYKDLVGDALALVTDSDATSTVYGVATWLTDARKPVLTVFTKDGEEVDYTFEDRDDALALKPALDFDEDKVVAVKFELNKDGEIKEGSLIDSENSSEFTITTRFTKDADNKYAQIGTTGTKYYFTKDTVILKAKDGSDLDPSVIDYDKLIDKGFTDEDVIFITDEDTNDLALVVFTNGDFFATDDDLYGIITGDPHRKGRDYVVEIDVAGEGKKEYVLSSLTHNSKELAKGDLIRFKLNNDDEVVVNVHKDLDEINSKYVTVTKKSGNYLTAGGTTYRVTEDTIFYVTTSKGKLDTTSRLSKIGENSNVIILANTDDELKVVLDVTPYTEPADGDNGDNGGNGDTAIYIVNGDGLGYNTTFGRFDAEDKYGEKVQFFVDEFDGYVIGEDEVSEAVMTAWLAENHGDLETIEVTEDNVLVVEAVADWKDLPEAKAEAAAKADNYIADLEDEYVKAITDITDEDAVQGAVDRVNANWAMDAEFDGNKLTVKVNEDITPAALEVDHNRAKDPYNLPEFWVYAEEGDGAYGDADDKEAFEKANVTVAYDPDTKTWTIDFSELEDGKGNDATALLNGIKFYLKVVDADGFEYGSMYNGGYLTVQ